MVRAGSLPMVARIVMVAHILMMLRMVRAGSLPMVTRMVKENGEGWLPNYGGEDGESWLPSYDGADIGVAPYLW